MRHPPLMRSMEKSMHSNSSIEKRLSMQPQPNRITQNQSIYTSPQTNFNYPRRNRFEVFVDQGSPQSNSLPRRPSQNLLQSVRAEIWPVFYIIFYLNNQWIFLSHKQLQRFFPHLLQFLLFLSSNFIEPNIQHFQLLQLQKLNHTGMCNLIMWQVEIIEAFALSYGHATFLSDLVGCDVKVDQFF